MAKKISKEELEKLEKEIKPEVKTEILKYISLENKNNLNEKKKILCFLGTEIDKIKINKNDPLYKLNDEIKFLLNKFNIRHKPHEKVKKLMETENLTNNIYDLTFRKIIKFLILNNNLQEDDMLYKKIKDFNDKNNIH